MTTICSRSLSSSFYNFISRNRITQVLASNSEPKAKTIRRPAYSHASPQRYHHHHRASPFTEPALIRKALSIPLSSSKPTGSGHISTPSHSSSNAYTSQMSFAERKTTPTEIIASLESRFADAKARGDVLFFPSTVNLHDEGGIQFEIRLCPALLSKPSLPARHFADAEAETEEAIPKKDPFLPPYNSGYLGDVTDEEEGETFAFLLNKYAVVEGHFLMVSKEHKSQTEPLTPGELVTAYSVLQAAHRAGKNFFAFYNCGDLSGASQPHKHLQFMPESLDGPPMEKLASATQLNVEGRPFALNAMPFAMHVVRFPSNLISSMDRSLIEGTLLSAFTSLWELSISSVRRDPEFPAGSLSYNVILTKTHMFVAPRRVADHTLAKSGDLLSVNSMAFAGKLLVKSEDELEAVKREGVLRILRNVGVESVHDELAEGEAHETDR